MGIRFFCPNGHKLNVKEFQAGRKGICPFCGARIQIPTQSTRPSSKRRRRDPARRAARKAAAAAAAAAPDQGDTTYNVASTDPPPAPQRISESTQAFVAPTASPGLGQPPQPPMSTPIGGMSPTAGVVGPGVSTTAPAGPAAPTVPSGPVSPAPAGTRPAQPGQPDPIDEAPAMIWYVRPPSGGQFGPASGEVMRSWLAEGRVSADSLIWREGWRDWQEAGEVFPKLRGADAMEFLDSAPIVPSIASSTTHPHPHHHKAGHNSNKTQSILLVLLSLAVIILAAVFFGVLFGFFR